MLHLDKEELNSAEVAAAKRRRVSPALWMLVGASLVCWIFILPRTQPQQRLRSRVERLLTSGHIEEALLLMSEHEPTDFPPHWEPPPHLGYPDPRPAEIDVLEALTVVDAAPWVRGAFLVRIRQSLNHRIMNELYWEELGYRSDSELDRYLKAFAKTPEVVGMIRRHPEGLIILYKNPAIVITEDQRQLIRHLLQVAGHDAPTDENETSAPQQ